MNVNYTCSSFIDKVKNNNYSYTNSYTKLVRESDTDVEKFQEKFEELRKNIRSLHNYSSNNTTDEKLKNYLTKLTDTYNSMVNDKDSLTDSSLQKQLDKLDSLIDDNAKALKKVGLKKTDGKLEFDEDTFDDDADKKTINKLFTGTDSFIDKAHKLMRNIEKSADNAQYVTTERHLSHTTKYEDEDIDKARTYISLQSNTKSITDQLKNASESTDTDIAELLDELGSALDSADKDEGLIEIYKKNEDNMKKVGFSFSDDYKTLAFDKSVDMTSDDFEQSYETLFGDTSSFQSQLDAYCKEGYSQAMKLETIGVDISL
jgi:hypothetical protein